LLHNGDLTGVLLHSRAAMPEKPRVKAPKQRSTPLGETSDRRTILLVGGGLIAAVVLAVVLFAAVGRGGDVDEASVRESVVAAGCTFEAKEAPPAQHSVPPDGGSDKWNTDPPVAGPHYGEAAIFNIYEDEVELPRVVHNLEHGGVYVLYGEDVPDATVEQLRAFYDDHKTGTIMAPLDRLGDEFALGAWVADGERQTGYLAKCKTFDEDAVSAFFDGFQFKGPERFDPSALRPGH